MSKQLVRMLIVVLLPALPGTVNAATTIQSIIDEFAGFTATLFPLALGIALLLFGFGVARFLFEMNSEDGRKRGRALMVWGIIALFVSVSLWGIVSVLLTAFGSDPDITCPPTQLNTTPDGAVSAC